MAAVNNFQSCSRRVLAILGNHHQHQLLRFNQIWSRSSQTQQQLLPAFDPPPPRFPPAAAFASSSLRSIHTSIYDKDLDEHVASSVVPDEILPPQSDKYWAPNPQTGVFGPSSEHSLNSANEPGPHISPQGTDAGNESVLEQKAFFRPLENLEKPQHL